MAPRRRTTIRGRALLVEVDRRLSEAQDALSNVVNDRNWLATARLREARRCHARLANPRDADACGAQGAPNNGDGELALDLLGVEHHP